MEGKIFSFRADERMKRAIELHIQKGGTTKTFVQKLFYNYVYGIEIRKQQEQKSIIEVFND